MYRIPAFKAEGAEILTVEGLAGEARLHPIQQAFLEEGRCNAVIALRAWCSRQKPSSTKIPLQRPRR